MRRMRRVVQGYFNYHAVPDNVDRLDAFRKDVSRAWLHALRWRGQHGRIPWARFRRLVDRYLPGARVLHPYPHQRFASCLKTGAVCGSAARTDLCGGGRGAISVPTATPLHARIRLMTPRVRRRRHR